MIILKAFIKKMIILKANFSSIIQIRVTDIGLKEKQWNDPNCWPMLIFSKVVLYEPKRE